jgi:hypothetical protein
VGHPSIPFDTVLKIRGTRSKAAVSHISRKTSEIWGTLGFVTGTYLELFVFFRS